MVGVRRRRSTCSKDESVEREGKISRRNADLPEDVIIDILKRLPVRSLTRFKCVRKLWYDLITSHDFKTMHSTHNSDKLMSLYIDSYRSYKRSKNSFKTTALFRIADASVHLTMNGPQNLVRVLGSANGLVFLHLSKQWETCDGFLLWNPVTTESRFISRREFGVADHESIWGSFWICFDSAAKNYKISWVKFRMGEGVGKAHIRTRTLCSDSSWVEKEIVIPDEICMRINLQQRADQSVFVNNFMYWRSIDHGIDTIINHCIICLDTVAEVFTQIEFPPMEYSDTCSYQLAPYKGSFALLADYGLLVDVWVLANCGVTNPSWRILLASVPIPGRMSPCGLFVKDENYLVAVCGSEDVFYISETGEPKKLSTARKKPESWEPEFFLYSESLFSVY